MWRFGIAAALLLLLAALVVDMLIDRSDSPDARGPEVATQNRPSTKPDLGRPDGANAAGAPAALAAVATDRDGRASAESRAQPPRAERPRAEPGAPAGPAAPRPSTTVPTTDRTEPAKPSGTTRETISSSRRAAPSGGSAEPAPSTSQVLEAQRKLTILGYSPGSPDGRYGRRTRQAVREFQRDRRLKVDGRIGGPLLAQLDAEVRSWTRLRQQEMEVLAPAAPPPAEKESRRGIFGTVLGGFQRLLGRDFDSVRRPDEIIVYCRDNAETWIYDFGREAFVYCGNIVADGLSGARTTIAPPPAETAETR